MLTIENRLVFVFDPTDESPYRIPNGKQTRRPSHIFYTSCSGIWQTVWLESVPVNHIQSMDIAGDMYGSSEFSPHYLVHWFSLSFPRDLIPIKTPRQSESSKGLKKRLGNNKLISLVVGTVHTSTGIPSPVEVSILDHMGATVAIHNATSDMEFTLKNAVPRQKLKLWSPSSPFLYNLTVTLKRNSESDSDPDVVSSYTGFRTISSGTIKGVRRPLLNGEFVFQFGTLDQGYWPDGIYLAPTLEAMVSDLKMIKGLGVNMVRKHVSFPRTSFFVFPFFPPFFATVKRRGKTSNQNLTHR